MFHHKPKSYRTNQSHPLPQRPPCVIGNMSSLHSFHHAICRNHRYPSPPNTVSKTIARTPRRPLLKHQLKILPFQQNHFSTAPRTRRSMSTFKLAEGQDLEHVTSRAETLIKRAEKGNGKAWEVVSEGAGLRREFRFKGFNKCWVGL